MPCRAVHCCIGCYRADCASTSLELPPELRFRNNPCMTYHPSLDYARRCDEADPLRSFRDRFALPHDDRGQPTLFLCGHSLGLMPLTARTIISEELDDWS